ncbi:MAG: translocation/assembly module TamB domain-containing protein [Defluviicoccus sp.]|nr:translocation/assembly module TamB domain-containing protein [Defluviicoccus sp.]
MAEAEPEPQSQRPRRRRAWWWLARGLGIGIGVLLLVLAGALAVLRTDWGLAQLKSLIETLASSEAMTLQIGGLEGPFPERLHLRDVRMSDADGLLISLDEGELRWHPLTLLARRLEIEAIELGTLTIDRLPAGKEEAEPETETEMSLPRLPIDIVLKQFHLRTLALGPAVAGLAAELTADADLALDRRGQLTANAAVRRLDGPPLDLRLAADYNGPRAWLALDLDLHEPADGLVASLLNLPGRPPIDVTLAGKGPLAAWQGRLDASAGGDARVTADIALAGDSPRTVRLDARADVAAFLPPEIAPLVAGGLDLRARADVDGARVGVTELALTTAAGSVSGTGSYEGTEATLDGRLDVVLGPADVYAALIPGLAYQAARLGLTVEGTLERPHARLAADAEAVALDDLRLGRLDLDARVAPAVTVEDGSDAMDLSAALTLTALQTASAELNRLFAEPARLTLTGRLDPGRQQARLQALDATAGPLSLKGEGEASWAGTAATVAAADATGGTSGWLKLRATAAGADLARAWPELGRLAGAAPVVSAEVRHGAEAGAPIRAELQARLADGAVSADAKGSVSGDLATVEGVTVDVAADDLGRLQALVPALGGGSLKLAANAAGPIQALTGSLDLTGRGIGYGAERIETLDAKLTAAAQATAARGAGAAPERVEGMLTATAGGSLGTFDLRGPFTLVPGERLRLPDLALAYADALFANANANVPFDGSPVVGSVRARADTLTPLGRPFGLALAGSLGLTAELGNAGGRQSVRATAAGSGLEYGAAGETAAPQARIERVDVALDLTDPAAERRLTVSAEANGLALAAGRLDQTRLAIEGARDAYTVRASTAGDLAGLSQLDTEARVRTGAVQEVALQRLDAILHGEALRLVKPARLTAEGEQITLRDLVLAYGKARAEADLVKAPARVDGKLTLRDLDLGVVERFAPGTALAGTANAEARLTGTPRQPLLRLKTKVQDFGLSDEKAASNARLNAQLDASVEAGQARAKLTAEGLGRRPLEAELSAPVRFALDPFAAEVPEDGAVRGRVVWQGALAPVMQMLPVDALALAGDADVNLGIGGTVRDPRLSGSIAVTRGSLEVFETGTILRPLDLRIAADGRTFRIDRLEAGDAGRGRLTGTGSIALDGAPRLDLKLEARDATLIRRDDVTSRLSGTVAMTGTVGEQGRLTARIENEATEIRLVNRLPPAIDTIDIVFADEIRPESPADETAAAGPGWLILDARVDLPRRVFVRGRGLESEWAGQISVEGPADKPRVRGRLRPVRGTFSLLGKMFTLEDGAIVIDGLDQDISINLTAAYQRADLKALLIVTGTAAKPSIRLSSEPELPQDEVLAQVLFNKASGDLGPVEAVQLAAAAAALASGEPGILDKLRDATGLDRLTVGSATTADGQTTGTVGAGRYVSEGVYVGIEQGTVANSTEVVVEIDLTQSLKARSTTSGDGRNRVGLRWQWDY